MATKLEHTKGKFQLRGKIAGISNTEKSYKEGYTNSNKRFKSLAFYVQTSESNRVKVELFGVEREYVTAYSSKAKESKKIEWAKRHDDHGDYKVMGVSMKIEGNDVRKVLVEYDAIDYIRKHLTEGDSVYITGEIDFQEYENQQGEIKQAQRFMIRSITKIEDINFEDEKFKEVSQFEQEIVAVETRVDAEEKKVYVDAKIIKRDGTHVNTTFTVDGNKYPKLANNIAKRLSFGDFIKVFGLIINAPNEEEVEEVDDFVDEDDWGGDSEIKKDFSRTVINGFTRELQITSVDSSTYEQRKYKEEDFYSEEEEAFNGNVDFDNDNNDDDFGDEEEIDDLPFI
jgi:single-stranded DNA-binding protein